MNKKLTLTLDDNLIEKAKNYAHDHRESLSHLVEDYLRSITSQKKQTEKEIAPIVQELLGSIEAPNDFDYDETKFDYLKEKLLNG